MPSVIKIEEYLYAERNSKDKEEDDIEQDSNIEFPWVSSLKATSEFDEQGQVGNQHH